MAMVALWKWLIILAVTVLIGLMLWGAGFIGPKKSPEVAVAEDEIECLAAAALADGKREPSNIDDVRVEIAKTLRRYSAENKTSVCDVFEKGLTMIPVGYKRPGPYLGRRRTFVKLEFSPATWNLAMVMAKQVLSTRFELLGGCATHYIRAERTWNESQAAIAGIKAMQHAPNLPDQWNTKFYCPKK